MKAFPRDIEVQTLKERHIGVESELGVKSGVIVNESIDWCCEDCSGPAPDPTKKCLSVELNQKGLLQSVGFDGGGREFRTNPISIKSILKQKRGNKYIGWYYDILKENTQVLSSGGTHIHVSILDTDHENMESNATALGVAFYEQFQKIAGRQSNWARQYHIRTNVKEIKADLDAVKNRYNNGRRVYSRKGSILNPTGHQTLEFRGPVGSNDKNDILAWVDFLNNVVKAANRKSVDGITFESLLKGEYIGPYSKKLTGWRKLKKSDLNKKINVNKLV